MTQSTQTPPSIPTPDELVARYLAAQAALEADENSATQPSPAVRTNVLAYAQQLADARAAGEGAGAASVADADAGKPINAGATNSIATKSIDTWTTGSFEHKNQATNDNQWKIRALASVAVFGLSSLLFFQWQNGSSVEQEAAFSMQRPDAQAPAKAPAASSAVPPAATADNNAAPAAAQSATTQSDAAQPVPSQPVPAPAPATAPSPAQAALPKAAAKAPEPARKSAADSSTEDKESAKPSALAVSPPADRAVQSGSAKAIGESTSEMAAATAPKMEVTPAPAPSAAAPALARGRMAAPAAKAIQNAEVSAARGQPDVNSALFSAIRSKNLSAVQTALANGADKNAKDNGTPAITLCVQASQIDLVRLLATAGADVNAPDAQGISPLDHARGRDLQDIMALLVQYGAK
jgi:Ankyrin repeats (many copies)